SAARRYRASASDLVVPVDALLVATRALSRPLGTPGSRSSRIRSALAVAVKRGATQVSAAAAGAMNRPGASAAPATPAAASAANRRLPRRGPGATPLRRRAAPTPRLFWARFITRTNGSVMGRSSGYRKRCGALRHAGGLAGGRAHAAPTSPVRSELRAGRGGRRTADAHNPINTGKVDALAWTPASRLL